MMDNLGSSQKQSIQRAAGLLEEVLRRIAMVRDDKATHSDRVAAATVLLEKYEHGPDG